MKAYLFEVKVIVGSLLAAIIGAGTTVLIKRWIEAPKAIAIALPAEFTEPAVPYIVGALLACLGLIVFFIVSSILIGD